MTTKPRLNALELHGYKTFAGRVLFEFPGNITAIVGPNGSGKSNIADALRWVLGEQSYSLLRGKKTEDMIFLGSDQRPRAGMASATINFNNDNGWLPIDYSEVAVSRRAYRDGSNEYLLNKQRVRLKDISELLAQSGLAERTYTIIGQGLVDAALSLRPEERRKFFEEAAGIGLFRSRREDALSRLDMTRRNLERASDIIGELEPRLRSLERQAKRMEEYDRVKEDLHVLLKDWYGFHWQNTQKDLIRNREILKNQEDKVNMARGHRTAIEQQVDASRLRLQSLRTQLNQWHGESSDLHAQREQLSKEIAVLEERLRAIRDLVANYENELSRGEERSRGTDDKLDGLLSDQERIRQEFEESKEQMAEIKKSFAQREDERSKFESALHENRRKLVDTETRMVRSKAHLSELQHRQENLNTSRGSLFDGIEKAKTELQGTQAKVEETLSAKTDADNEIQQINEQLKVLRESIISSEDEVKGINSEISRISAESARISAQIEVLQQAENALTGMGEGARNLILASQSGKLKGKISAINNLLDVPPELEIAIGSVLGEQLDAVVLGKDVDTDGVLSWMEDRDAGRAVILPGQQIRKVEKLKPFPAANVLGVASDLVKGRGEFTDLVNLLLGNVLIVSDRQTARSLAAKIPAWGRIVTLKGEVFNGNGTIIAGKENRSGVISRPRQKRDLDDKLQSTLAETRKLNEDLISAQNHLADLQQQRKIKEEDLKSKQVLQQQAQQTHDSATRNLAQITQRLEWQNSQIQVLVDQLKTTESEISTLQGEITASTDQAKSLNALLRETGDSLRQIPIDDLQTEVVHWNTAVALNERAVKDGERRISEFEQTVQQNRNSIAQTLAKIEELKKHIHDAMTDEESKRKQETEINASISSLQERIDPAESELNTLESQYSQLQQEYSQTQQLETNADRVYSQVHLDLARSREGLESLRRKIEEDFGLIALEYSEDISGPTPLPLEGVKTLVTLTEIPRELEDSINRQRTLLRRMGAINPEARNEYLEVKERFEFMSSQMADLQKADADLRQIIAELDELMHKQFRTTFNAVAAEFKVMFSRLFGGGSARLLMTDDENPTETGIDIEAKLPGRREQGLSLLSGGERALTAVALIFSLLRVSPTPFCVLDEVDAMLDEANVGRFTELLKELSEETQFIVITHNRNTVQVADVIYGVTMGRDSASQVISLRLDELSDEMVK